MGSLFITTLAILVVLAVTVYANYKFDQRSVKTITRPGQFKVVDTTLMDWAPVPDTQNMQLKEIIGAASTGGPPAVALVRCEAGASVEEHDHPKGSEVFILEGECQDKYGTYQVGTDILFPTNLEHAPKFPSGCLMLVQTGGYNVTGEKPIIKHTSPFDAKAKGWRPSTNGDLISIWKIYDLPEFFDSAMLYRIPKDSGLPRGDANLQLDIWVMQGTLRNGNANSRYSKDTFISIPKDYEVNIVADSECVLYARLSGSLIRTI